MKYLNKYCLLFTLLYMVAFSCAAQESGIRISLMTCSPGQEVYSLYGHTAIRCQDTATGEDLVYNYGTFNFNTPHFIWRFVRGETDYELGVASFYLFADEYRRRGSSIIEQVLDLRPEEALKLKRLLETNALPENRTYRYNYFYDNCTTRARDRIEEAIDGKVIYPESVSYQDAETEVGIALRRPDEGYSYRSIVHQFTKGHPWAEVGNDFLLGAQADRPIGIRQQMFSPFYLMAFADSAHIEGADGQRRPLVGEKIQLLPVRRMPVEKEFPLSPMACASLLLALTVLIGLVEVRTKRLFWGYDILLYGAQGVAGLIVAFMFFFSVHPTVGSNWLIILFNPLPLLCLPWILLCVWRRRKCLYHKVNFVLLILFLLAFWGIPQKFGLEIVPLALSLLVRTANHLYWERKNGK